MVGRVADTRGVAVQESLLRDAFWLLGGCKANSDSIGVARDPQPLRRDVSTWVKRETAMDQVSPKWLDDFDAAMKRYFLIDHADAGMGEAELLRYADLLPQAAALQFGEDYELQRVDTD